MLDTTNKPPAARVQGSPGAGKAQGQGSRPVRLRDVLGSELVCFLELPSVMKLEGHHHHLAWLPPTPEINN